jgi:heme/copper-type cytochrome/quinol oxidase subunit 1
MIYILAFPVVVIGYLAQIIDTIFGTNAFDLLEKLTSSFMGHIH